MQLVLPGTTCLFDDFYKLDTSPTSTKYLVFPALLASPSRGFATGRDERLLDLLGLFCLFFRLLAFHTESIELVTSCLEL